MPIAMDPTETFDVILKVDRGKDPPPTFRFRYGSVREWKDLQVLTADLDVEKVEGAGRLLDSVADAVAARMVGWEGITDRTGEVVEFVDDVEALGSVLEDVVTAEELWELYWAVLGKKDVAPEELGNSLPVSHTERAESAETVPGASDAESVPA